MEYTELAEYLLENGEIIKEQMRTRKYKGATSKASGDT